MILIQDDKISQEELTISLIRKVLEAYEETVDHHP